MTFSNINVSNPNDGLGDKLRDAFIIVNDNFSEVEGFLVSQVTDSYLSATLSNYVTLINFNNQNNSIGATISTLQSDINNRALLVHTHSVSNVTGLQGQLNSKATITQLNNAIAVLNDTIAELNITLAEKIDEAPQDDNSYVRKNGAWIISGEATPQYKVYTALLSQSGTDAPTAIVLENTLGQTITWSYNGTGNWVTNTIVGGTSENLWVTISKKSGGKDVEAFEHNTGGPSAIYVSQTAFLGGPQNDLEKAYIEIRVYN